MEEKTPPVLVKSACNSQKISPIAEPKYTRFKTESPLGKRRSIIKENECLPKKVCVTVDAAIQKKQILTTKNYQEDSPLQAQTCSKEVSTIMHRSLVSDSAAEIQTSHIEIRKPQSIGADLTRNIHSELQKSPQLSQTASQSCVSTNTTADTDLPETLTSQSYLHLDVAHPETSNALHTTLPAVMFSDDENEADEGKLWDTQLNKQIDKVQIFLKLDKLRRPKKF